MHTGDRLTRRRPRYRPAALALLTAALVAGCGSGQEQEPPPADEEAGHSEFDAAVSGLFLGACGSATAAQVAAVLPGPELVEVRTGVGCDWRAPGTGEGASFTWYRGSPIGRERALVEATGRRVQQLSIGEFDGYVARQAEGWICEVALGVEEDFFLWSVAGAYPGVDLCEAATELAAGTVEGAR